MRDYWGGEPATLADFAARLTGSSDLYAGDSSPASSINFVTAHDGFTLNDLVSYDHKHNEANGEEGRDGESHNRSWNCGAEGPTDDAGVLELRARQQRNLLLTLLLSQGVPMLLAGDELARTQQGNNNAYCQDGKLTWVDWDGLTTHADQLEFTRAVIAFRRLHPVFHRRRWFTGRDIRGGEGPARDLTWIRPDGTEMSDADWDTGFARAVGVLLDGRCIEDPGPQGEPVRDDSFLVLFNAHHGAIRWTLPPLADGEQYVRVIDTRAAIVQARPVRSARVVVAPRSTVVLRVDR